MNNSFKNEIARSNKRLRIGRFDSEERAELASEKRAVREERAHLRQLREAQEDRDRYIIPEHLELEEALTN